MSRKLDKISMDLKKAYAKRDELNEKIEILERKYKEQEDLEICEVAHLYSVTSEELAEVLDMVKGKTPKEIKVEDEKDGQD